MLKDKIHIDKFLSNLKLMRVLLIKVQFDNIPIMLKKRLKKSRILKLYTQKMNTVKNSLKKRPK